VGIVLGADRLAPSIGDRNVNEHAFSAAELGVARTEQEMTELVGDDSYFAHLIGYAIGYAAGLIAKVTM
jgi:hypothetical protein